MTDQKREKAGRGDLGTKRYRRCVAAFDRVEHCLQERYYIEAIAILDSLISDRLASRLGFLANQEISAQLTCGQLCNQLVGASTAASGSGAEKKHEFRAIVGDIQSWVQRRNDAMHGTAKILRGDEPDVTFDDMLKSHCQDAVNGRELLRRFDDLDTAERGEKGKRPATAPNAFFPERRGTKGARRLPDEGRPMGGCG